MENVIAFSRCGSQKAPAHAEYVVHLKPKVGNPAIMEYTIEGIEDSADARCAVADGLIAVASHLKRM